MVALQLPSASSAVDRNDMEDYHHGLMEQEYLRDTHDTFKKGQRPLLVGSGLLGTYTYMLPYLREIFSLMNFKIVHCFRSISILMGGYKLQHTKA